MTGHELNRIREEIPEGAVFIIGAGHFGSRAGRVISQKSDVPVFVVDVDDNRLSRLKGLPVKRIQCDGIRFLVKNFHLLDPANTIVPAVPLHLAYEWVKGYLKDAYVLKKIEVPGAIRPLLPHTWQGSEGSLLVSYADFMCPDDCPEPDFCS
jgi:hypothetical protein